MQGVGCRVDPWPLGASTTMLIPQTISIRTCAEQRSRSSHSSAYPHTLRSVVVVVLLLLLVVVLGALALMPVRPLVEAKHSSSSSGEVSAARTSAATAVAASATYARRIKTTAPTIAGQRVIATACGSYAVPMRVMGAVEGSFVVSI
jgi:hypothetical protein